MRVTIIRDDNSVAVDGEGYRVDLAALPADFHALQWDGTVGEIEYRTVNCEHCAGRSKKPNAAVSDLAPYQIYLDAWSVAKVAADAQKAAFAAEMARIQALYEEAANAAGPKG